jgi:hypothetical protein
MADSDKPMQKTKPKKGKPVAIPVLKRSELDAILRQAAKPEKR